MSTTIRRILVSMAALACVLAVGYAAAWFIAARSIETGFERWVAAQANRGVTVEHGPTALSGFPGKIRLDIPAPGITDTKRGWHWSAERTVLEAQPWDWRRHRMRISGAQRLAAPFAGGIHRFTARAETTELDSEIDTHGRLTRARLRVDDGRLFDAGGTELFFARNLDVDGKARSVVGAEPGGPAFDLIFRAVSVTLGPTIDPPLGRDIAAVELTATLNGALPEDLSRGSVDAWREGGGTLEVSHILIDWGDLTMRANGTASLDEALRPLGALTADIKGYAETLTALERARLLRGRAVTGTRLALDLLSRRDEADNRRMVTIPLAAQNGLLYVGPVRLLRLAPIPFPVR